MWILHPTSFIDHAVPADSIFNNVANVSLCMVVYGFLNVISVSCGSMDIISTVYTWKCASSYEASHYHLLKIDLWSYHIALWLLDWHVWPFTMCIQLNWLRCSQNSSLSWHTTIQNCSHLELFAWFCNIILPFGCLVCLPDILHWISTLTVGLLKFRKTQHGTEKGEFFSIETMYVIMSNVEKLFIKTPQRFHLRRYIYKSLCILMGICGFLCFALFQLRTLFCMCGKLAEA